MSDVDESNQSVIVDSQPAPTREEFNDLHATLQGNN